MSYYTVYGLGPDGSVTGAMSAAFETDAAALAFAQQQLERWQKVEVWVADRHITTLPDSKIA